VTNRKKKIFIIQTLLFLVAIILIYQTYYTEENSNLIEKEITVKKTVKEADLKKNTFENVEYKGIDLNGNRYIIKSKNAEFDSSTPELINMKIMEAIFYFKDGTVLIVSGDYGNYNNKTNDMEFRKNIIANYNEYNLYADNLDFFNTKNLLTIYGNVLGEGVKGNIKTDILNFDLNKKTLDISTYDNKQTDINLMEIK